MSKDPITHLLDNDIEEEDAIDFHTKNKVKTNTLGGKH